MQIQIPKPKPPIDQGATSQQTYVFPVSQPDTARVVAALAGARYQPPSMNARYQSADQGATQQQTSPIPPVLTRPNAWYGATSAFALDARRMTGPRPMVDQGATVQGLFQFFPALPEFRYYVRNTPAPVVLPIDGATIQQTSSEFTLTVDARRRLIDVTRTPLAADIPQAVAAVTADVFNVNQPAVAWTVRRPSADVVPSFAGATLQSSFVFSPNQPEPAQWYRPSLPRYLVAPAPPLSMALTVVQTDILRADPVDVTTWWLRERARLLGGPSAQLSGATSQATFPVPLVSQPELTAFRSLHALRFLVAPAPPAVMAATVVQADVFRLEAGDLTRWALLDRARALGVPVPQVDPVAQATVPVPAVSQPELVAYRLLQGSRFLVAAPIRLDGATISATHPVPPVSQPELTAYLRLQVARTQGGPIRQLEGAAPQATFLFPVSQPLFEHYRKLAAAFRLDAPKAFDGATRQATYLFPPHQPDSRWFIPVMSLRMVGPTPQREHLIPPAALHTYLVPPSQPLASSFRRPGMVAWDMPVVWMPQGSWNELDGGVVILVDAEARVILVDSEPHEIVVLTERFIIEPEEN